jgi:hypothetical protein
MSKPFDLNRFLYKKRKEKLLKHKDIREQFELPSKSSERNSTVSKSFSLSPALQSSKSAKTKTKSKPLFSKVNPTDISLLPGNIQYDIFKMNLKKNKFVYELRSWIKEEKLDLNELCKNPNAINYLEKEFNSQPGDDFYWKALSTNPNAIKLIKEKILRRQSYDIHFQYLSSNPNALELIEQKIAEEKALDPEKLETLSQIQRFSWCLLSYNPNPNAIKLLAERILEEEKLQTENKEQFKALNHFNKINWSMLSYNPNAIELLKQYPEKIDWGFFLKNPNLPVKLLEELVLKVKNKEVLRENEKINWFIIWTIPKAIKILLKHYPEKIIAATIWRELSDNTHYKAIELLSRKAIEEKILRENNFKKYINLTSTEVIDWSSLSSNPKAIELLEEKAIEEEELKENNPKKYEKLYYDVVIDWKNVSANPKAIKLLEKYPQYIDLEGLCANPNAVKLIRKNIDILKPNHWKILSSNPCIFKEL